MTSAKPAIKERPIIFGAESVRAILEGRKTQTRRVCKGAHELSCALDWPFFICPYGQTGERLWARETWQPYNENSQEQSDAIRQSLARFERGEVVDVVKEVSGWGIPNGEQKILYAADFGDWAYDVDSDLKPWRSPIFMSRKDSRITLEIVDVRVERLQDISEDDAIAEGVQPTIYTQEDIEEIISTEPPESEARQLMEILGPGQITAKFNYLMAWDSINAKRGFPWSSNPFVWVLSFKRLE